MSLQQKIDQDLKQAMIARDEARLSALRMLKSAVKYAAIDKPGAEQTDADVMQVLQKQIKQRKESIQQFTQGNRTDLAAKEQKELGFLESYLPKQISDAELTALIEAQVKALGATSKKDFGRVMKACTEKLAGQADNARISGVLGKLLP